MFIVVLFFIGCSQACDTKPIASSSDVICTGNPKICTGRFVMTAAFPLLEGDCMSFVRASASVGNSIGVTDSWNFTVKLRGFTAFASLLNPKYVAETTFSFFHHCNCDDFPGGSQWCENTNWCTSGNGFGIGDVPCTPDLYKFGTGFGKNCALTQACTRGAMFVNIPNAWVSGEVGGFDYQLSFDATSCEEGVCITHPFMTGLAVKSVVLSYPWMTMKLNFIGANSFNPTPLGALGSFVAKPPYYLIPGLNTKGDYNAHGFGWLQREPTQDEWIWSPDSFATTVSMSHNFDDYGDDGCNDDVPSQPGKATASFGKLQDHFLDENKLEVKVNSNVLQLSRYVWDDSEGGFLQFNVVAGTAGTFSAEFNFSGVAFDFDSVDFVILNASANGTCSNGQIYGHVVLRSLSDYDGEAAVYLFVGDKSYSLHVEVLKAGSISVWNVTFPGIVANKTASVCDDQRISCVDVEFVCHVETVDPPDESSGGEGAPSINNFSDFWDKYGNWILVGAGGLLLIFLLTTVRRFFSG